MPGKEAADIAVLIARAGHERAAHGAQQSWPFEYWRAVSRIDQEHQGIAERLRHWRHYPEAGEPAVADNQRARHGGGEGDLNMELAPPTKIRRHLEFFRAVAACLERLALDADYGAAGVEGDMAQRLAR
jgi:hypothetical protein